LMNKGKGCGAGTGVGKKDRVVMANDECGRKRLVSNLNLT